MNLFARHSHLWWHVGPWHPPFHLIVVVRLTLITYCSCLRRVKSLVGHSPETLTILDILSSSYPNIRHHMTLIIFFTMLKWPSSNPIAFFKVTLSQRPCLVGWIWSSRQQLWHPRGRIGRCLSESSKQMNARLCRRNYRRFYFPPRVCLCPNRSSRSSFFLQQLEN